MTIHVYHPAHRHPEAIGATAVIGTFGEDRWAELAAERAIPSALREGLDVVHAHTSSGTLADARNLGDDAVETEWTIHVDADDELGGAFAVHAGRAALAQPDVDVFAVKACFVHPSGMAGVAHYPKVYSHSHDCSADCLPDGNWLIIGCPVRTDLMRRVRWEEWPVYEDWSTWLRCYQAGARFGRADGCTYVAFARWDSRNRADRGNGIGVEVHRQIARKYGVPVPP